MTRYQRAYEEGYSAYLNNKTANPYKWGAEEWSGWKDGWSDAEKLNA